MHWMKIVTGSCPGEPGAESGAGKSPAAASRDAYHVTKEAAICAFTPTIRELSDFSFLRECLQALQGLFFLGSFSVDSCEEEARCWSRRCCLWGSRNQSSMWSEGRSLLRRILTTATRPTACISWQLSTNYPHKSSV